MIRTPLTERLGITYPIIQAGMGGVARAELVAAVSNAGGLGVIGAGFMSPAQLREEIRKVKDLTDKPFGVDLLLARDWPGQEEMIEVIIEERVPVFASGLGNPAPYVEALHQAGITVMAVVGTVRHARRVVEGGTDIVVAQGTEGGGHTGRIATLALVPQVVDAVAPTPVVAAGGIADGRVLVAALCLGAVGVWVGTAFLVSEEAHLDPDLKRRILEASEEDTRVTRIYTGKTARVINNPLLEEWERRGLPTHPIPYQGGFMAQFLAAARDAGRKELLMNAAGQVCGMLRQVRPAREIVEEMVAQAVEALSEALPKEAQFSS
jgi:NAD(P)H-dependent flavin oxidoreductase YrpB (nitropropane dioxygenase family)